MRCLLVKKYSNYELKSKLADYGRYSVRNRAFFLAAAASLFFSISIK